jgi:hypothetical protein
MGPLSRSASKTTSITSSFEDAQRRVEIHFSAMRYVQKSSSCSDDPYMAIIDEGFENNLSNQR